MSPSRWITSLQEVKDFVVDPERPFFSATHQEIAQGYSTDIYFISAQEILRHLHLDDTTVVAEVFARRSGIFCGLPEVISLLSQSAIEIWGLP
ncbi:MAG: nicotinate phosphoribosyltransferase, partial [Candidatus Atribacteria bacterium]|nr:nicotinate phosphoribosyltransferase [Candidatus Atribacteria bacterium]